MLRLAKLFNFILSQPFIWLIYIYKYGISPVLGANCRFQPSCSSYMLEAIQQRGVLYGIYLGSKRILRCHPFSEGGFDPVPSGKKSNNSNPKV